MAVAVGCCLHFSNVTFQHVRQVGVAVKLTAVSSSNPSIADLGIRSRIGIGRSMCWSFLSTCGGRCFKDTRQQRLGLVIDIVQSRDTAFRFGMPWLLVFFPLKGLRLAAELKQRFGQSRCAGGELRCLITGIFEQRCYLTSMFFELLKPLFAPGIEKHVAVFDITLVFIRSCEAAQPAAGLKPATTTLLITAVVSPNLLPRGVPIWLEQVHQAQPFRIKSSPIALNFSPKFFKTLPGLNVHYLIPYLTGRSVGLLRGLPFGDSQLASAFRCLYLSDHKFTVTDCVCHCLTTADINCECSTKWWMTMKDLLSTLILCGIVACQNWGSVSPVWANDAEDEVVAYLKQLQGQEVIRDKNLPGNPVTKLNLVGPRVTNAVLVELAVFPKLTSLNLIGTKVTDAGLKGLAELESLTTLNLRGPVTDAGLKELAALKKLTSLSLFNPKVTDAGLKELAALEDLTSLDLHNSEVTDAVLKELAPLKRLTTFSLDHTRVTDAGLKELAVFPKLTTLNLIGSQVTDRTLSVLLEINLLHVLDVAKTNSNKRPTNLADVTSFYLNNTQVTDAGLKELAALKNLASLYLDNTKVTDAGMKELAVLKNLTTLSLDRTQVTDAGIKELATLKNLTTLKLDSAKVTDAGLKELQKALPKLMVSLAR